MKGEMITIARKTIYQEPLTRCGLWGPLVKGKKRIFFLGSKYIIKKDEKGVKGVLHNESYFVTIEELQVLGAFEN